MQKLNISDEEKVSRKEYLKNKKKQTKNINSKGKKKYVIIALVSVLAIYVFVQFYIYYKQNNYVYSQDEHVDSQKVYNMYFLSEGYTYEPKTSLNTIKTNSFDESVIYADIGLKDIKMSNDYIYGIKEGGLYKLNKSTNELISLVKENVKKFTIYNDEIYASIGEECKLNAVDGTTGETRDLNIGNVKEILVDESDVYICSTDLSSSILYKVNKQTADKKNLTNKEKVSYIIQDANKIYFVNKSDGNKIYSVNKDGSNIVKVGDIKTITDTGDTEYVDGSKYVFIRDNILYYINTEDNRTLWKINLDDKNTEKVIHSAIDVMSLVDDTVFYKVYKERGVYLYNLDTTFSSQVSKRLIKEFLIER